MPHFVFVGFFPGLHNVGVDLGGLWSSYTAQAASVCGDLELGRLPPGSRLVFTRKAREAGVSWSCFQIANPTYPC